MSEARRCLGMTTGSWAEGEPKSWDFHHDVAMAAENLGYEYLIHGDHMFPHNPNMDSMTVVTYWAAITKRIKVGPGVLLMPLREPVLTAKALSSIDRLSKGRLIAGIGIGGEIAQEWTAMEVDPATRGARTDEYIDIIKACWGGEPLDFTGRFRTVKAPPASPSPYTKGGPPIWIGGRQDSALRRASRHQGWLGYLLSPRRAAESVAKLKEMQGGELRPGFKAAVIVKVVIDKNADVAKQKMTEGFGKFFKMDLSDKVAAITAMGTPDDVRERVQTYFDAGVTDVILSPTCVPEVLVEQMTQLAEAFGLKAPAAGTANQIAGVH